MVTKSLGMFVCLAWMIGFAAPASAQDDPPSGPTPGEVATQCVSAMQTVVQQSGSKAVNTVQRGVERIAALAEGGAPPQVIVASAEWSNDRIEVIARSGQQRVTALERQCVQTLVALGAPTELIAGVRNAAQQAREAIREIARNGRMTVRQAARAALGGG